MTAVQCGAPPAPPEVRQRLEPIGAPPIDLRLMLQPAHQRQAPRYIAAVTATLKQMGEWLGPLPHASLTIVDPPWRGPAVTTGANVVVLDRTPWWSSPTAMTPELTVARGLARRRWAETLAEGDLPAWFIEGLAEFSARRAVVPLFEADNLSPGYAFLEQRFFGGFVPRFARVRLLAETDGEPLPAYRANPAVTVAAGVPAPDNARSLEAKTVLALGTLERWVSRPVFDQVIAQFARDSRSRRPSVTGFAQVAADVSGQDLAWFFEEALASSRIFDYGVERLTSEPDPAGQFSTTAIVRRYGDARFTGSNAAPSGPFEAGRGVSLLVQFADGQQRLEVWDGRAIEKMFRYHSPARAVSAVVDPDRIVLLDVNRTNNSMTLAPLARSAASMWAVRWMLWLEQALLNYGALV